METKKTVAIVSPANFPSKEKYEKGLEILRQYSIPFKSYVDFSKTSPGFKAFLLYELITNKDFFYIWTARGGFGSIKLLPYLDELLSDVKNLKFHPYLIGFSDITALHLYFYKKFNKPGIHAPMIADLPNLDKNTIETLFEILFRDKNIYLEGKGYQEGEIEGILLGGNLVTMASLCGTPYFPYVDGIILFIEDINEKLYRLERALIQVIFTLGKEKIKALIIGDLGREDPLNFLGNIKEFLPQHMPIGYEFPIGHNSKNYPVIIGKRAYLKIKNNKAELYQEKFFS